MDHMNTTMNEIPLPLTATVVALPTRISPSMYFHFSATVHHLLFKPWNISTDAEIFGAMVFSFALAIVYEGLKTIRELLMVLQHKWIYHSSSRPIDKNERSSLIMQELPNPKNKMLKIWVMRGLQSVLRTVEIGMAYLLMLLAMTYNGWLFLTVCVGAGTGNFIFSHFRSANHESSDHCG